MARAECVMCVDIKGEFDAFLACEFHPVSEQVCARIFYGRCGMTEESAEWRCRVIFAFLDFLIDGLISD